MSSISTNTKSKCRTCGEKFTDTGNFQLKIRKSKPIPLKIRKLIKAGKLTESKKNALKQTKFGRFLLKRGEMTNTVEITCGQCSSSCQIRTKKPFKRIADDDDTDLSNTMTPKVTPHLNSSSCSSTKRRKKRNKEINAGLIIPQSSTTESIMDKKTDTSMYEFKSDNPSNTPKPVVSASTKPVLSKEKEMDNLRKVLFKSKKKSQQQGPGGKTCLKDFLSSM